MQSSESAATGGSGTRSLRARAQALFEVSRGGAADNLRPMEGLRGFAVFLVFLVHYTTLVKPVLQADSAILPFAAALHAIGNAGVDLFFVLSGFLIYGSLIARRQDFLRFMRRRVQRIYPAFAVVFLLYLGLSLALPSQSRIPAGVGAAAAYLLANFLLLPGMLPIEPMITVAWSLSFEFFYYLTIPLVIAAFRLRERPRLGRVLFFALVAVVLATCTPGGGDHPRLAIFVAGILLYEALATGDGPSGRWPLSGPSADVLALAGLAAGLMAVYGAAIGAIGAAAKVAVMFAGFFCLCRVCLGRQPSGVAQLFSWTPLRWLGNMSYSYYLLHGLTLKAAFVVWGSLSGHASYGDWIAVALLPPMFGLTLLSAALLFAWVERPFSLGVPKAGGQPALTPG